jgi:serine protease Do
LDAETRQLFGVDGAISGLVVTEVATRSSAWRGFEPGVIITRADNRPLRSVADLRRIIADMREGGRPSVLLDLSFRGQPAIRIVELDDLPVADSGAGR